MMTVFLGAVFKPFFKIISDTGQQLTIDRTNFLTDDVIQIIQHTGFVSVNTRFEIPQSKKSHAERSGERGGHGTSPKRETRCVVHKHVVLNRPSLHCYWIGQPRGKECRPPGPPPPPIGLPTNYYPLKRCQVPLGHPVYIYIYIYIYIYETSEQQQVTPQGGHNT